MQEFGLPARTLKTMRHDKHAAEAMAQIKKLLGSVK